MKQLQADLVELRSEQLTLLGGPSLRQEPERREAQALQEATGSVPLIAADSINADVRDLMGLGAAQVSSLADLQHPVTAYLNGLAPSSRRPQLSALDWIARRVTQLYTAETMPCRGALPARHDLRRTWIGDLLDLGVDLATVQKMAGHASASTTGRYDRRDRGVQRRAATFLRVPYEPTEA